MFDGAFKAYIVIAASFLTPVVLDMVRLVKSSDSAFTFTSVLGMWRKVAGPSICGIRDEFEPAVICMLMNSELWFEDSSLNQSTSSATIKIALITPIEKFVVVYS